MSMDTILVVSDYPIVQEGLHKVLSRRGYRVVKAMKTMPILDMLDSNEAIKLILMDLSVKEDIESLKFMEEWRRQGLKLPIFILTPQEDLNIILTVEDARVQGVALKNESIQELVNGVKKVVEGEIYKSPEYEQRIKEAKQMRRLISAKDREVLRRLTTGEANRDIATAMGLSEKTVEYHRSNILKKLGARSMFEATRRALHLGVID